MRIKTMQKVTDKTKIRHRNELNRTIAQLPVSAKRLMFMAMISIDSKNPMEVGKVFSIKSEEMAQLVGIDKKNAYRYVKEAADILLSSRLFLDESDLSALGEELGLSAIFKNKNPKSVGLPVVDYCAYFDGEGYVDIRFSRNIEPYISKLVGKENKYTEQIFLSAIRMNTHSAGCLYQLLRKKRNPKKQSQSFTISIDELKDELGLRYFDESDKTYKNKYPVFAVFKRDILNKAVKEIIEKTEIKKVSISTAEKKSRKVEKLRFDYTIPDIEPKKDQAFGTPDQSIPDGFRG